jgi:IS30 family transposase
MGSPQQISGWLRSGAEPSLFAVAMETIYAFIYRLGQKDEELWRCLARRRKKRRALRSRPSRDRIKGRVSIHDRPGSVDDRSEMGHWPLGDASITCQLIGG